MDRHRVWSSALLLAALATATAQGQSGPDYAGTYNGSWGDRFGIVGGPIVTVNGYLYPVYQDRGGYGSPPVGYVNAAPVLGDWSTGYDRLDPLRYALEGPAGNGAVSAYGAWGWAPGRPGLFQVAGPPVPVVAPYAVPAGPRSVPSLPAVPRFVDLARPVVGPPPAPATGAPRILVPTGASPGTAGAPLTPTGPHHLVLPR